MAKMQLESGEAIDANLSPTRAPGEPPKQQAHGWPTAHGSRLMITTGAAATNDVGEDNAVDGANGRRVVRQRR